MDSAPRRAREAQCLGYLSCIAVRVRRRRGNGGGGGGGGIKVSFIPQRTREGGGNLLPIIRSLGRLAAAATVAAGAAVDERPPAPARWIPASLVRCLVVQEVILGRRRRLLPLP